MSGTGSVACTLHNGARLAKRFLNLFGGPTITDSNYSTGAYEFVIPFILGSSPGGFDPATLAFSKMIILWGNNPADTHMGTEMFSRLMAAKKSGTPIIVIDPRRSTTVDKLATWWLPCRPGTDVALMMAVLYMLIQENMVDTRFVERYSIGFNDLRRYVLGEQDGVERSPAWAAPLCGIPAGEIIRFARQYGRAKPAALIPGYAIQRTFNGEAAFRMTIALQVATGNLGTPGGSSGDRNNSLPTPRVGCIDTCQPDEQPIVPMLRWPDAILEGRRGGYPSDIKAIYNVASNFLNQGADIRKNIRAFESVEFSVCHDIFLTPTARYCDIVLPATTFLERSDIAIPWAGNYLLYSNQAVEPVDDARNDYDIFCSLAERLGFSETFSEGRAEAAWLDAFIADSDIRNPDAFRESGIYMAPDQMRTGLAKFVSDPTANPLDTPSGKVELSSQAYSRQTGFPPIAEWHSDDPPTGLPLRLITPKSAFRIHSQGSNIPWLRRRASDSLWLHPQDAADRGIADNEMVYIHNRQGVVRTSVRVSAAIMPGVVCLPEGLWCEFDEDSIDNGGAANTLTTTDGTLPSLACVMHAVPVQVSKTKPINIGGVHDLEGL